LLWQALWPLLDLALERDEVGEAIDHARVMLRPDQQVLPDAIAGPRRRAHTWRKRWPRRSR
jgi:hypothetical protein